MTDRELMQQALEALNRSDYLGWQVNIPIIKALRERLAQPNDFNPDWDAMAVMVEEQQRMAKRIAELEAQPEQEPANYKELLNKSESRLHEVAVHCERVERRLREVNTAAMKLTSDLTCMEIDDDDRLSRDRVMERVMQWRNEWDKAMHNNQPQMQPCAGRNCGSTNPNLHSAECFEDYEKATGMSSVEHAVIAGALFDFMGWLTSRKERIVLSSADNASPAVEAITEFAKMRGLSLADAKVTDWQNMTRGNDAA